MSVQLIKDKKYSGQYVALKDFKDNTVICKGAQPQQAYQKAVKKGYNDPVIIYVPAKNIVQIY